MDATLEYVIFLTRHIRRGNVPKAILLVLMELGFVAEHDGFGYLRKAIFLKYSDSDLRMNILYRSVGKMYEQRRSLRQIEGAIRSAIESAWAARRGETWHYFSSGQQNWDEERPANGIFISTLACVMELWCDCQQEVCYAGE